MWSWGCLGPGCSNNTAPLEEWAGGSSLYGQEGDFRESQPPNVVDGCVGWGKDSRKAHVLGPTDPWASQTAEDSRCPTEMPGRPTYSTSPSGESSSSCCIVLSMYQPQIRLLTQIFINKINLLSFGCCLLGFGIKLMLDLKNDLGNFPNAYSGTICAM